MHINYSFILFIYYFKHISIHTWIVLAIKIEALKLISNDPRIIELKNCRAQTSSNPEIWMI